MPENPNEFWVKVLALRAEYYDNRRKYLIAKLASIKFPEVDDGGS